MAWADQHLQVLLPAEIPLESLLLAEVWVKIVAMRKVSDWVDVRMDLC
jgi:hypothetical protein